MEPTLSKLEQNAICISVKSNRSELTKRIEDFHHGSKVHVYTFQESLLVAHGFILLNDDDDNQSRIWFHATKMGHADCPYQMTFYDRFQDLYKICGRTMRTQYLGALD